MRKCGRVTTGGAVAMRDNGQVAHYSGLQTCGSIWSCPCCSPKIRNTRAAEISTAAANWVSRHVNDDISGRRIQNVNFNNLNTGGGVYMATFTAPHDLGMRLAPLVKMMAASFRHVIGGRPWQRIRGQLGIVGTIRAVEVTHGRHGWHPHLHVLVFTAAPLNAQGLAQLTLYLRSRWADAVTRAGYRMPHDLHGVDVRPCTSAAEAGAYIAKVQDGGDPGNELARGDLKSGGRSATGIHRTPFEILEAFRWTGDLADLILWREYEQATFGHQCITWSKGLRQLTGAADTRTDEEIAAEEVGGDIVVTFGGDEWRQVCAVPGLPAHLLDEYERAGLPAVAAALRPHGIQIGPAP